jgi:predicted dehydrogenase
MGRPIGVGFIGCGMVSELHHLALTTSTGAYLVGVFDLDPDRAARRAETWGVRAFADLQQLLDDPGIEAVFVLTPLEARREQVLAALRHGKHVLVEKPVGASLAALQEMARAAEHHQRVLMPGHNYVYQPDVWRARRLIREGHLGRICATWVNYAIFHSEEIAAHYHGVLREVLTHHLYLVLYLLGRSTSIWATRQSLHYERLDQDDQALIILQMEDGSIAQLFATFAADDPTSNPWTFMFKVLGTQGGVSYSWRDAMFQRPLGTLGMAIAPYEESFRYEVEHFIERCIGRGEAPLSTITDAMHTQRLLELAAASVTSGQTMRVEDEVPS